MRNKPRVSPGGLGGGKKRKPIPWGKFVYFTFLLFLIMAGVKFVFFKTVYIEGLGILDTEIVELEARYSGRISTIRHDINDPVSLNEPIVFLEQSELEQKITALSQKKNEKAARYEHQMILLDKQNFLVEQGISNLETSIQALKGDIEIIEKMARASAETHQAAPKNNDHGIKSIFEFSKIHEEESATRQEIDHKKELQGKLKEEERKILRLVESKVLTQSHLDKVRLELSAVENELSLLNIKIYSLEQKKKTLSIETVNLIGLEIQRMQKNLATLKIEKDFILRETGKTRADLNTLIDEYEKEKESLKRSLEDSTLHSPMDGVVLEIKKQAGEVVMTGEPVIVIGDKSRLRINAFFEQTDAQNLQLGDRAEISFATGETGEGTVTRMYPSAWPWPEEYQNKFGNPGRFIQAEISLNSPAKTPPFIKARATVRIVKNFF